MSTKATSDFNKLNIFLGLEILGKSASGIYEHGIKFCNPSRNVERIITEEQFLRLMRHFRGANSPITDVSDIQDLLPLETLTQSEIQHQYQIYSWAYALVLEVRRGEFYLQEMSLLKNGKGLCPA